MLEIMKFNPQNAEKDVNWARFNPFNRQCVLQTLVCINEKGKIEEVAKFITSYPKYDRDGTAYIYTLLQVWRNQEFFVTTARCGGGNYSKSNQGKYNCAFTLFDFNDKSGGLWDGQIYLEAIAKFFGYNDYLIV